jgi:BirA family biotin operon repressor/biotin-[acetyl-CoA-carboxylase] ligase
MKLPLAQAVATTLTVVSEVASTNDTLRLLVAERERAGELTDFVVVASPHQTAGRGRMGRAWVSPPGATLAISVLVAPSERGASLGVEHYGWFPLIAGVAMARAVVAALPSAAVGIKWPNDVQVSGAKVSGILTELVTDTGQLIIGVGVNLDMTEDQLPVPTATSLAIEGAALSGDELADLVASRFLTQLRALTSEFIAHAGDATASGTMSAVTALCTTIGAPVRVEFPDNRIMIGRATGIDSLGRLQVHPTENGSIVAVAAGDVTHLRYE